MSIEPRISTMKNYCKVKICEKQINVECKAEEQNLSVGKIVSITADSFLLSKEVLEQEVRVSGKVDFAMIYCDTDNLVDSLNYSAKFSDTIKCDAVFTSSKVEINTKVEETEIIEVVDNTVKCSAIVLVEVYLIKDDEISFVSDIIGAEIKSEEICVNNSRINIDVDFPVEEETNLSDILKSVLTTKSDVFVNSIKSGIECFVINGEIVTYLTFKNEDETENIRCLTINTPFKYEALADNALLGMNVVASAMVKDLHVSAFVDEVKKSTTLKLEYLINIKASTFEDRKDLCVTDAFTTLCEINKSTTCFDTLSFLDTKTSEETVSYSYEIAGEEINKIAGVSFADINVLNTETVENNITVDGTVKLCVIGYNDNGIVAVFPKVPFSVNIMCENLNDEVEVLPSIVMSDVSVRNKLNSELDIALRLKVRCDIFNKKVVCVLSNIEQGEEKSQRLSAIGVLIPSKGETLWDIAKRLNTMPDVIMKQNPGLEFPLMGEERIVVFRQCEAKKQS